MSAEIVDWKMQFGRHHSTLAEVLLLSEMFSLVFQVLRLQVDVIQLLRLLTSRRVVKKTKPTPKAYLVLMVPICSSLSIRCAQPIR